MLNISTHEMNALRESHSYSVRLAGQYRAELNGTAPLPAAIVAGIGSRKVYIRYLNGKAAELLTIAASYRRAMMRAKGLPLALNFSQQARALSGHNYTEALRMAAE